MEETKQLVGEWLSAAKLRVRAHDFVVCEGIDGAGKSTALSHACNLLEQGGERPRLVNVLNGSFSDPMLVEMLDYAGRIVLRGAQRVGMPVLRSIALADALRYSLILEGTVSIEHNRETKFVSDSWSYKRLAKNIIAAEDSLTGNDLREHLRYIVQIFLPTLVSSHVIWLKLRVRDAVQRKTGEMTQWDVGLGHEANEDKASAFIQYQQRIEGWLELFSVVHKWSFLDVTGLSPSQAGNLLANEIRSLESSSSGGRR